MSTLRRLDAARKYGRSIQPIHDLEPSDSGLTGSDIFAVLDVSEVEADAQPKKVTISGVGIAAAPFVASASGSARGPLSSVQYNNNGTLDGNANFFFTGSGIYASGVSSPSYTTDLSAINTVSSSGYTLLNSDNGRTVIFTNAEPTVVTVPSSLADGFNCTLVQTTVSGQVTVTSGTGVTLNSAYSAFKTTTRYSVAGVIGVNTNSYIVTGDITI